MLLHTLPSYLFWMGDLNYRIEGDYDKVVEAVREGKFDELMKKDQVSNFCFILLLTNSIYF